MTTPTAPARLLPVAVALGATAIAMFESAPAAAAVLFVGGLDARSRGLAGLVGWIVAGAILGAAVGYGVGSTVSLPLSTAGAAGLGAALGGGVGGISQFLTADEQATADDERVTVDMASDDGTDPRPADLFEEHPDPVLYVTTAAGGPVVRAANAAYERIFDLPATAIEDAPLGEVLRVEEGTVIVDSLADGDAVDETLAFETTAGRRRFRVRSVAATDDGYLLFTPVAD